MMRIKTIILSASLILTLGACAQSGSTEEGATAPLPPQKAQKELKEHPNTVLLDVRTPREYNNGHLKEARLMDFYQEDFQKELEKLPKDKSYLVYCHSGGRSGKAVQMMRQMGFEKVYDLKGGVAAWNQQDLPLEKER
ncbi:MAG: rhodanese-like domain-containing protein [Schleiferiaceae bacterium]|nr:rhodanese-like domain-containing protein [Schleiferiaceae bacterium]MDR9442419.1 rhodanese-like domain-containing protein [Schleiferiaceae bacterium]